MNVKPTPTARPWAGSPYRRRRFLWTCLAVLFTGAFYIWRHGAPSFLSLAPGLKDMGLGFSPDSSHAGRVAQARPQLAGEGTHADVREVDAFLHFVLEQPARRLDEDGGAVAREGLGTLKVDGERAVDLRVYAPDGDHDWAERARRIHTQFPLVVFSKTYCPYSKRAKELLASYDLSPPPKIIELNKRTDGPQLQAIVSRLTGRPTVPNILLKGGSMGGSDELQHMHDEHRLKKLFEEAGFLVKGDV
ncbi:glutaredoxin [Trametes maxima]|nr:glutaredoxin [Trametes maxima]